MTKIVRIEHLETSAAGNSVDEDMRGAVISIGNFDGVHVGHAALLKQVKQKADSIDAPSICIVFDPHPAVILRPELAPPRLTTIERRAELLGRYDIDYLLVCETTRDLLNLSAESFFQILVVDLLQARAIFEGPNFFFGRGRGGNVETLTQLSAANDIDFQVVRATEDDNEMVSSTRIRALLEENQIEQANTLLGSAYRISGLVCPGSKRGREIGFPTANLSDIEMIVPGFGVYGGWAWMDSKRYAAAIHIGPNPTFGDPTPKVEVHVLDFSADLYGQQLYVDLVCFVRDVRRFDSVAELSAQLTRDVETVRERLE